MSYSTLSAAAIASSSTHVRRFVSACLMRDGFMWYDPPKDVAGALAVPGTEFSGDGIDALVFIRRGRHVLLRLKRGPRTETHGVSSVKFPDDMSSNYIFVVRN